MLPTGSSDQALVTAAHPTIRLSVISPTFNEVNNVDRVVEELSRVLSGIDYEIIIVDDDSPDLTWQRVDELSKSNPRVRLLRRRANRGLGMSVIDGFVAARGEVVACIDADLQHDPSVLPQMLGEVDKGSDLVVACRYMPGGGTSDWSCSRRIQSLVATKMAQWFLGVRLRDPMSGFFGCPGWP